MRRFNQFINGDREEKFEASEEVKVKNDRDVKIDNGKRDYEDYLKKLQNEREEIAELIYTILIVEDNLISEVFSEDQKAGLKCQISVEDTEFDGKMNGRAHYKSDFVDVILRETEPMMEKGDYVQIIAALLTNDETFKKYEVYSDSDQYQELIFSSNTYINKERAKKILLEVKNEDENDAVLNKFNEIRYVETGDEQRIAQEAGNSRPYTDFFDEFVPNKVEESKRAHKYTVSLHRAI